MTGVKVRDVYKIGKTLGTGGEALLGLTIPRWSLKQSLELLPASLLQGSRSSLVLCQ